MKVNCPAGHEWVLFEKDFGEFILINIRQVLSYEDFDGFKPVTVPHCLKHLGHENTRRLFKEFGDTWMTKEGFVFYKEYRYV